MIELVSEGPHFNFRKRHMVAVTLPDADHDLRDVIKKERRVILDGVEREVSGLEEYKVTWASHASRFVTLTIKECNCGTDSSTS